MPSRIGATGAVARDQAGKELTMAEQQPLCNGKIGKAVEPGGKFSALTEHILSNKGVLAFPPVSYREMQFRWESFCHQVYGATPLRLVSDYELKRAVLFVSRKSAAPLLITADTSDEWTYQVASDEAIAAMRRDENGMESGFAGLDGEGSMRSRWLD
jgi:hypothetical protein